MSGKKKTTKKKTTTSTPPKKKNIETSKLILVISFILAFSITIFTCVASILVNDLSPLSELISSIFKVVAIAVAFYFWKAKNENIMKYSKQLDKLTKAKDTIAETNNVLTEMQEIGQDQN